jgi:hypothetical protein
MAMQSEKDLKVGNIIFVFRPDEHSDITPRCVQIEYLGEAEGGCIRGRLLRDDPSALDPPRSAGEEGVWHKSHIYWSNMPKYPFKLEDYYRYRGGSGD